MVDSIYYTNCLTVSHHIGCRPKIIPSILLSSNLISLQLRLPSILIIIPFNATIAKQYPHLCSSPCHRYALLYAYKLFSVQSCSTTASPTTPPLAANKIINPSQIIFLLETTRCIASSQAIKLSS